MSRYQISHFIGCLLAGVIMSKLIPLSKLSRRNRNFKKILYSLSEDTSADMSADMSGGTTQNPSTIYQNNLKFS